MRAWPVYPRAPINATLAGWVLEEFLLPKGGLGLVVVAYPRDEDGNANDRIVRDIFEIGRRALVEKARARCICGDA